MFTLWRAVLVTPRWRVNEANYVFIWTPCIKKCISGLWCENLNPLITSDTFLPIVGKIKPSPNSEIRFHLVCCTVLTKSALPIRIKKPIKKIIRRQVNILCWNVSVWFLDAIAKLRRATIGFFVFVCLCAGNCATSRKVARSIPDGVIAIFHWRNPFGRTVAERINWVFNPLTPNDYCSGRTAPLTSKHCILYIYATNIGTEYFKHGIYSPFFSLFKMQFVS